MRVIVWSPAQNRDGPPPAWPRSWPKAKAAGGLAQVVRTALTDGSTPKTTPLVRCSNAGLGVIWHQAPTEAEAAEWARELSEPRSSPTGGTIEALARAVLTADTALSRARMVGRQTEVEAAEWALHDAMSALRCHPVMMFKPDMVPKPGRQQEGEA